MNGGKLTHVNARKLVLSSDVSVKLRVILSAFRSMMSKYSLALDATTASSILPLPALDTALCDEKDRAI